MPKLRDYSRDVHRKEGAALAVIDDAISETERRLKHMRRQRAKILAREMNDARQVDP